MSFITALSRDYSLAQVSEARMIKMMAATTEEDALAMGFLDKFFDTLLRGGKKQDVHKALWEAMNTASSGNKETSNHCDALHFDPKKSGTIPKIGFLPHAQIRRLYRMQDAVHNESNGNNMFSLSLVPVSLDDRQNPILSDGYLLTVKLNGKTVFNKGTIPCPEPTCKEIGAEADRERFLVTASHVFALTTKYSDDGITEDKASEFIKLIGGQRYLNSDSVSKTLEKVQVENDRCTLAEYVNRVATNSVR